MGEGESFTFELFKQSLSKGAFLKLSRKMTKGLAGGRKVKRRRGTKLGRE